MKLNYKRTTLVPLRNKSPLRGRKKTVKLRDERTRFMVQ